MGSDLQFADEFEGVSGISVTTIPAPTPTQQFVQDPTSYVLLGILAVVAVGLVLFLRNKSS